MLAACLSALLCPALAALPPHGGAHALQPSTNATLLEAVHSTALGKGSTDEQLEQRARDIKKLSTAGGMEVEEYVKFMKHVRDHAPQRLLVWGLGYDSVTYNELNEGGNTTFLEFDASWVPLADAKTQALPYHVYNAPELHTATGEEDAFLAAPHRADKVEALSGAPCFDTVLIDSPLGEFPGSPGRAVPIYTAKADRTSCKERGAAGAALAVFVHDCRRPGEDKLTTAIFGSPTSETGPKKLREFGLS